MAAKKNNSRLALILGGVAIGMVGVAFAAVPAYRLFCQVTGYGGTPKIAEGAVGETVSREVVTVRFDATTNQDIPWKFKPGQVSLEAHLGQQILAHYSASNPTDEPITGTATFNITPLKAAQYFTKIDCFCFTEQTLAPGETVDMPVLFYVDPAMSQDEAVADVHTLTLSYTFFRKDKKTEEATGTGS